MHSFKNKKNGKKKSVDSSDSPRLVLSRFEIEPAAIGESPSLEAEDEEEVWLFWKDPSKEVRSKSIRELAQDAKEGQKEDQEVVSYYRSEASHCVYIYMLAHTHARTNTRAHAHTSAHACVHIHKYTQTHTDTIFIFILDFIWIL